MEDARRGNGGMGVRMSGVASVLQDLAGSARATPAFSQEFLAGGLRLRASAGGGHLAGGHFLPQRQSGWSLTVFHDLDSVLVFRCAGIEIASKPGSSSKEVGFRARQREREKDARSKHEVLGHL
jgi:hypothetical protein